MKANELMIGDWVKPFGSHEGVYARITSITPNRIDMVTTSKNLHHETAEYTYPIPLTPEILEKNGFHKEWDDDIILMVCDTIKVEIGDRYNTYKDGKMYLRRVLAPLYYVHELQHALRLCGIDKKIEL